MKVLLALCLLSCGLSVLAFPTLQKVPPQCADPTFACQDLESARLCGVVSSCIHDIWATMNAPDDNDEICDICKEMVKEARDQLLSNMTQEEIKEVFEGSCKLLPIKLVADGCIKIVDEIIPEIVEMLASRMDPNMVCTVSGLCNMAHLPLENHILKILYKVLTHNADQCTECTTMMAEVKTFMSTMPEAEMKVYAEKVCAEKVPHYLCDILVGKYFPEVYDYVTKNDPKEMCTEAGVCKQTCGLKEPVGDELVCEFCTHVLEHIKQEVTANTTVEEFRTALLNFCKLMGSFSDKCTSVVNDYYDTLFDYIRKMDTKELCTLIGLCTSNDTLITPLVKIMPPLEMRKSPLIRLQPALRVTVDDHIHPLVKVIPAVLKNKKEMAETNDIFPNQDINALPLERFTHPVLNFERDTECAFCKAITFYLHQDLQEDRSKLGIRKAMSNVCDKWVKEFPEQCESFLNKYSQKVEYAIAKGDEYETMCTLVKACPLEDTHSELEVKVIPNAQAGPFCDLCKELMTQVENKLKDPNTEKQVKDLFNQACNTLPSELRDVCTNFVSQNVDALFTILQQELTPDNICPALKFCTGTPRITAPHPLKDLECDLCKEAVTSLRQQLQSPEFKNTILQFLDKACSELPGDLGQECQTLINNNIDTVIGVIIQVMDPDTVCSILKICPGQVKAVNFPKIKDIECDLCKEVVGKVEDIVKEKKTQDDIRDALDKVCGLLPSKIEKKCQDFVNQYVELLISLITEEADPEVICAALKVCPTQDLECQSCQYALHFLQETLVSADTQDKVKNVLKQMCDMLPDTYSKNCEAFVDEYGSAFLALLAQELDPNTICWEMKMCRNQTRLFKVFSIGEIHSVTNSQCDVCTQVANYLVQLLEEDDIDKEITALVEKVCVIVPSSLRSECASIIETYGPYILQMIGQMTDGKQICQEIDLCTRPHGQVHLLGGSKCTFGPSYWCQSNAHASACKAETYCKQRVWLK